jgi:lipoprotein signal peptidase
MAVASVLSRQELTFAATCAVIQARTFNKGAHMTRHAVAVILYVIAAICIVVGLLDVLNIADYNEGTGYGLIVGGAIIGLLGYVLDRSPRV